MNNCILNEKLPTLIIFGKFKGIGEVHFDFYKLILFYRVLSEISDIFNPNSKYRVRARQAKSVFLFKNLRMSVFVSSNA